MSLSADEFLESELFLPARNTEGAVLFAPLQAERTTKKDYRAAYIYLNITSYSQRSSLHKCGRFFQILKSPTLSGGDAAVGAANLDFIFGHAVGAGIQTYLATGSKDAALFACFLSWNTELDAEIPKKGKSSALAHLAIEKFIYWWEGGMGHEWELATFNNKPATELTFFLDTENGYYHAGHIDAILRHRHTGRYLVLEIKTTAIRNVDEAQYGNSEQPLGYSLILDKIAHSLQETASFEVLYLIYSSTMRELLPMPFTKNRQERIEWLQDLLLDHTTINTYAKLGFFPKRGESCWSFGGRCPHYGLCDLEVYKGKTDFKWFDVKKDKLPEPVDFMFTLSEMTEAVLRSEVTTTPKEISNAR